MNKKEIAMRIKQLREDHHLHQKEVAAVLGISQSAYSDLENGHTAFTAVALDKLAEFYGKALTSFYTETSTFFICMTIHPMEPMSTTSTSMASVPRQRTGCWTSLPPQ
jgi:transcriptional regulator with XRE-family HTH domain